MAYSDIKDPSAHFQTKLYTGTGSELVLTNDGNSDLQPDFLWIKNRTDGSTNHHAHNTNVATTRTLFVNKTDYEETQSQSVKSIQSDGFTLGTWGGNNLSSKNFVAWQWKANGGTTSSNTDGSITTTTQVNSDAGFSIVTWAGGGTGSLGHGLGVVPDMWIVKNRDYAVSWAVGFSDSSFLGGTSNYLSLNTTQATLSYNNIWGSSPANSSTITMAGDRSVNISGDNYVAYFFKAKQGYSKFGKYTGNGNANGPFIYTGFKPAFFLLKKTSGADGWRLFDNKRAGYNDDNYRLAPDAADAEDTATTYLDILSNGVKIRGTAGSFNQSGGTFIYMAFAENPFVAGGVPTTAR